MSRVVGVVLLLCLASVANANLLFGGSFAVGDPYCIYCPDTNPLSPMGMSCHCPTGYTAYPAPPTVEGPWKYAAANDAPLMRVGSTCGVNGDVWRSSLSFCIAEATDYNHTSNRFTAPSSSRAAAAQFAGFYQRVSGECAVTNPVTHDCSCPSDSEEIVIPHMSGGESVPTAFTAGLPKGSGGVSSVLVLCGRRAPVEANEIVNFGGAFTTNTADSSCHTKNPFTGSCSCPSGSSSMPVGLVDVTGKGMTLHTCGPKVIEAVPNIQICDGVDADPTGNLDAGPAITRCCQQQQQIQFPLGIYLINTQIKANGCQMQALEHEGDTCLMQSSPCPTLKAGPSLSSPGGIFVGRADFENIVIDGNKFARQGLVSQCATNPAVGYNILEIAASGQGGFQMQGCAVINAVCGAGVFSQIVGGLFSGAQIQQSLFRGNGDHNEATKQWANGIHIAGYSNGFQAQENYYTDNTDSHIAVDEPTSGIELEESTYVMQGAQAFAGIRYSWPVNGTFFGKPPTDVPVPNWGNQIQDNTIQCNGKCYFGIQMGGRPWIPTSPIVQPQQGCSIEQNTVSGAVVLINIDAGVTSMQQNNYGGLLGRFAHCTQPSSLLNISPESRVSRDEESAPATHITYAGCVP